MTFPCAGLWSLTALCLISAWLLPRCAALAKVLTSLDLSAYPCDNRANNLQLTRPLGGQQGDAASLHSDEQRAAACGERNQHGPVLLFFMISHQRCWVKSSFSCSLNYSLTKSQNTSATLGDWKSPLKGPNPVRSFFFFFFNLFIFGHVGSSLLRAGFLWLRRAGAALPCGARASHCGGFSCCGARALGAQASVVMARGLSGCGLQALERRLSSCGARA